jgi:hypothetical protein
LALDAARMAGSRSCCSFYRSRWTCRTRRLDHVACEYRTMICGAWLLAWRAKGRAVHDPAWVPASVSRWPDPPHNETLALQSCFSETRVLLARNRTIKNECRPSSDNAIVSPDHSSVSANRTCDCCEAPLGYVFARPGPLVDFQIYLRQFTEANVMGTLKFGVLRYGSA